MDGKNLMLLALLLVCLPSSLSQSTRKNLLKVLHQWTFANFNYNSTKDRSNAEQLGHLTPGNVAILDADYFIDPKTHQRRIFVTSPLFLPGIPATFSEVRDRKLEQPVMSPYPSWDAQNIVSCSGPVSVYRIFIDKCGWMWVLDSGMVETFLTPKRACNPKILIYNLNKNDELVAQYDFPEGVVNERSILITLVTESYQSDCQDSIAYIADVQARGLIIFDYANRSSWRVENPYFYPFPDHGIVRIKETTFELMDGLFGLALSPETDRQRKLYFHSAASIRESWVLVSVLKNSTIVNDVETLRREFHHSEDVRDGQSTVEVMSEDGILIYPVLNRNALACWNSAQPLKKEFQYIIYEDSENLQFISGMKLKNKTLMITSSKLQNYLLNQANGTDVKYRVMMIDNIDQLLDGTPCRKSNKPTTTDRPVVGTTHRPYTTTHKSPTSQHTTHKSSSSQHTTHKPSVTSSGEEIDNRETLHFTPPYKSSSHNYPHDPPYWHHPQDLGSSHHFHSTTTFEAKIPSASFHNQHWPQEQKSQKPQLSKESTNRVTHPKSSAEEKLSKSTSEKPHSDLSEGETHNKPSVVSKSSLHQISRTLPNYGYSPSNILEFY